MEEKPKKSNRIYLIIIVVLALALIGTGGYLMYDKMNEKEEPTKTQEKEKDTEEENLSLDDARFYSIYQTLNPYTKIQTRANGFQSFISS